MSARRPGSGGADGRGGRGPSPGGRGAAGRGSAGRGPAGRGTDRQGRPGIQPERRGPAPGATERTARVAERVRAELADMLLRGEIRDPDAAGAIVSAVQLTTDLSLARIYVRLLEAAPTPARQAAVVKALDRAKGHVRRELAGRLALRIVPELRFAWDDTADRAARLDELLAEVAADRARDEVEREGQRARDRDAVALEDARDDDPTEGRGGDDEP